MKSKPRVLDGRVRDVVDSGESVVETEAGVVLVRGGLPGERLRVRTESQRQGVLRGSLVDVLERSRDRVEPPCPYVEHCGGCPLMSLDLPAQRALKAERLARALANAGCATAVQLEAAGPGFEYRRRARLAFRRLAQRTVIGYRQGAAHMIADVGACLVLVAPLSAAFAAVRERLGPALEGSGEIELTARDDGRVLVQLACDAPVGSGVYAAAEALARVEPIAGVSLRVANGAPARFGEVEGSARALDGAVLHAPADAFSQANEAVNRRLSELVVELAAPEGARVLELYAGHGNFSLALAARASAFWAVEGHPAAAEACRKNLAERGFSHARVYARDVDTYTPEARADVVVLDPPRAGAKRLGEIVQATKATRVVYVSCHMTTLARDLKSLVALGFRADRAHALDMFPQTAHVEAVVHLRLSESSSKL